jgi:hypothetical protein
MGVLESEGILSKGIEVIMPAFELRAAALDSSASNEPIDPLVEYRELRDPARLPVIDCVSAFVEFNEAAYPSKRSSVCLSLYNFLPKNDLLEVPCLGFSGAVVGIVIAADAWKTAWAWIQSLKISPLDTVLGSGDVDEPRKVTEYGGVCWFLAAIELGDGRASQGVLVIDQQA